MEAENNILTSNKWPTGWEVSDLEEPWIYPHRKGAGSGKKNKREVSASAWSCQDAQTTGVENLFQTLSKNYTDR